MQNNVIIIGSGIAGLAVAIRLAVAGYEVEVFESNAYPGGKLSSFTKDGFHFDAGPSLFTQPWNITELFELCGEEPGEYFRYRKLENTCRYFFEDGKIINAYSDAELFQDELVSVADEKGELKKYLEDASVLFNNTGRIFLDHTLHSRKTWVSKKVFHALKHLKLSYLTKSLDRYNKSRFSSNKSTRIFNRFATYNGSDPYRAPAMLSMIPHLEYNEGIYYPEGGMVSITNSLYELALRQGVRFHFNKKVDRIIHWEGKATGIVSGNENITAGKVISNADIYFTYRDMLKLERKSKKLARSERSSSALVFYWGMSKQFPELDLHNIFFTEQQQMEFEFLFKKKAIFNDPTIYINITSKQEHIHAPEGMENWFVMINAPSDEGQQWNEIALKARSVIISKISRILGENIEPFIISETVLDPIIMEQTTGSYKGALYGTASNNRMSAFFRHPNFSKRIKDLYFCGGSVHPGGGIPLCLRSARIVTDLISSKKKRVEHQR